MLDNILNTVRQGVEQVQRRGEELTQVARLRVEVFQLSRDLEGHFARLGRAYHNGADHDLLQGIRADIQRTEGEIRDREQLIAELGDEEAAGRTTTEATAEQVVSAVPAKERLIQLSKADADAADTPAPSAAPATAAAVPSPSNRPAFVDAPLEKADDTPR